MRKPFETLEECGASAVAVRAYLDGLRWDGSHRLADWAGRYLGALSGQVQAAEWLVSAVARAFEPGCLVKGVLVLRASQAAGKSWALRALAGPFYSDGVVNLDSRHSALSIQSSWIVELPSLSELRRAEVEAMWAFVARSVDLVRAPYARSAKEFPRSCVFAATAMAGSYLLDAVGGQCWWVVDCGRIDSVGIECDRDQIWAEAVVAYRAGMPWC